MVKKIIAASLAASMAFSLGACGGGQTSSGAASGSPASGSSASGGAASSETAAGKQAVKFAVPTWMLDWSQAQADTYNAQSDKYAVEVIEIVAGADMYTKMTMMMQSPQTCPDVMDEDGFMINADAAAGYLEPLDDLLGSWEDLSQFSPKILDGARAADGKLYAIPFSTDTQGIWYNKKMFATAGIATPWQPTNWNEIMDAAEKLKAVGGEDFIPLFLYATKNAPEETSMRTFQSLYSGTHASLYDYDQQKWVVDKENLSKVFGFVNDVYNVNKVGPALSIAGQKNVEDLFLSDYMKNDKLGIFFSGNWITNNWGAGQKYDWPEALDTWGFANIPSFDGSDPKFTTMSGGWTWAIPKNAGNKEGAVDFIKYLASKEVQLAYALERRDLAVRQDVMAEQSYQDQQMSVVKETISQMDFAHFRPSVEGYSTLTTMFTEVIESIAMGAATPEQALATFESEMIRIVGADQVIVK